MTLHLRNFSYAKERVIKNVLDSTKNLRKNLTRDEIQERGLNIYEKREHSINSLIDEALERGWIRETLKNELELTKNGVKKLMEMYTSNFSEEFLNYEKEINALTEKYNEPAIEPLQIATFYRQKTGVEFVEKIYIHDNTLGHETEAYHHYVLQQLQKEISETDCLFHLEPKLFLPLEDRDEDVSLTIHGVDIKEPIIIGRPYPNKRYAVAGYKIGREKLCTGFYPIISSKENFPTELEIVLHWNIGELKEVIHHLFIQFEFDKGYFFSTNQHLFRSSTLPYLDIRSLTIED